MQNISYTSIAFYLMVSGLIVMIGCNNNEGNLSLEPQVTFSGGNSMKGLPGETVQFKAMLDHEIAIERLAVKGASPSSADTTITGIGSSNFIYDFNYVIPEQVKAPSKIDFAFAITDEFGNTAYKDFAISVIQQTGEALMKSTINLGAQGIGNEGGFYSTALNKTYFADMINGEKRDQRSNVDFIYYQSEELGHVLASPSDQSVERIEAYRTSEWAAEEKNMTKFTHIDVSFSECEKKLQSGQDAKGNNDIRKALENSNQTKFDQLQKGETIAFLTEDDRIGVLKVASIHNGQNIGEAIITLKVKVESR